MTDHTFGSKASPEPILTDVVGDVGSDDTGAAKAALIDEKSYPAPGKAWYCVFVLALAVMVNFLDRGILTLLVEPIKRDLNLTDVQMSLIMGFAFTFFYSILGLPVARMVDRRSRKKIMAAGIAIWSLMTAFCGLASSFWQLFMCRVGVGVGETTSGPSAYSLLSDYFPPSKLPRAIAGMNLGFVAGSGLAMVLGGAVIGFIGDKEVTVPVLGSLRNWQVVLMLVGLPGLIVAALMLTVSEPPRHGVVVKESQPVGDVFKFIYSYWPIYIPLFLGLAMRSAQMFGMQMWGPAFYMRTFDWGPEIIGYVSGVSIMISMPLGLFLGSWFAEYYYKKGYADANMRVVVYSTLISIPLSIIAPLMPDPWIVAGMGIVNFVFMGMAAPVENAAIQTVTPNKYRGQVTFLFLFTMNVIGMGLGPLMIGSMTQYIFGEDGIRYALVLSAAIIGPLATYIFWYGMKPYGKAIAAGGLLETQDSDKTT
ncbi:MFS transporter [Emcibacter sp.]|uniref:spinster family MFS transporter n=1 Tax=Emcibacter sp. TaxID=1979954 RepID=UPI002AA61368|nr:MFS transporter [Emcibacter sp.]